jgi:putative glutamine amidotransferase
MRVIGITDTMGPEAKFKMCSDWILNGIPDSSIIKLSCLHDNAEQLTQCHGLLLAGGNDVHPKFYHREDMLDTTEDVNEERDEFEIGLIRESLEREIPILGVCRGMQVFNVAMGGSLIPDIERAGYPSHRRGEGEGRRHPIRVEPRTLLQSIANTPAGNTNTSHHQAVEKLGTGLRIAARSDDGIIEALEWEDSSNRPFLMLVQWHPERMKDTQNPFAKNILGRFENATMQFQGVIRNKS